MTIEIGKQAALGVGNGDAPDGELGPNCKQHALLQARTADLLLEKRESEGWRGARQGCQGYRPLPGLANGRPWLNQG